MWREPPWSRADDGPGGKQLVAYIVAVRQAVSNAAALRHYLAERLPDYMVPSAFVMINALPLTSNGKLDRRSLPSPASTRDELTTEFAAPSCDTEEKLARIWCQVLRLERVGIRDDFFELGGHSLLLLQLWDQISKTFGQVYPLNLIYQNRTIEQMAALLQQGDHDDEATTSPSISVGVNNDRPVVFGLNYALAMARYLDDVPIYALAGYEKLVMECDSIEEMAKVNVERMREHQKNGPYRLSGFCGMALVAFEMARLLHQRGGRSRCSY